jgi:hypothetical protein
MVAAVAAEFGQLQTPPVVAGVQSEPYGYLTKRALAGGEVGVFTGAGEAGKEKGREERNDGHHHQKLYERKAAFLHTDAPPLAVYP